MSNTETHLAMLIGSRICHDLISPIGAIHNGLELLDLSGQLNNSPEMQLIADSCKNARDKVQFFRLAFGVSQSGQVITKSALQKMIAPLFQGRLLARYEGPDTLERPQAQCVLLALLCLETALPQGGQILIDGDQQTLKLTGTGPSVDTEDAPWSIFNQNHTTFSPAQVHFDLLAAMTDPEARHIALSDDKIEISF